MSTWKDRLEEERGKSQMAVVQKPLDELKPDVKGNAWGMRSVSGTVAFARSDEAFFIVRGVNVSANGREVDGWEQPLVFEQGPDVYVIVTDSSRAWFLCAARQEPGNPESKRHVLLGPPLQASLGNLKQARPVPRQEFFHDTRTQFAEAAKDGGRFISSGSNTNRIGVLVLPDDEFDRLELKSNEIILSRAALREAFLAGDLNPYMREVGMALLL